MAEWLCVTSGNFKIPNIIALFQQFAEPACSDLDGILLDCWTSARVLPTRQTLGLLIQCSRSGSGSTEGNRGVRFGCHFLLVYILLAVYPHALV